MNITPEMRNQKRTMKINERKQKILKSKTKEVLPHNEAKPLTLKTSADSSSELWFTGE